MKVQLVRNLAIFLLAGVFAAHAEEPLSQELPPEQEAAAIRMAEATGLDIYRHDHAAAVATDAARKLRKFKKDKRIRGWITEEQQDGIVVTFIDQTPAALYRTMVSGDGVSGPVTAYQSPVALSEYEAGAAAARKAAMESQFQPCTQNYNPVVLPRVALLPVTPESGWVVYLLPGTTKTDVVPIGGTYRMEIDGSGVVNQRGFTRTCISLQNDPRAVGLMITHLLDPIPTEVHVFWSLWVGKSMAVATPPHGSVWMIEDGRIKLIRRGEAKD